MAILFPIWPLRFRVQFTLNSDIFSTALPSESDINAANTDHEKQGKEAFLIETCFKCFVFFFL